MPELGRLRKDISTLEKGDEPSRRQVIVSLRSCDEKEWTEVPSQQAHALVDALLGQLASNGKPSFMPKEVAIILGNMGSHSKSAVRQLAELLNESNPEPIRETAAAALGRIGKDAIAAVEQLIGVLEGRNSLAIHAVRSLGSIGCTDQRVRAALVKLWMGPQLSQNAQVQLATAMCKLKVDARGMHEILTGTLMSSQDPDLRKAAAEALGWCSKNDLDVVPALQASSLSDKNEDVRQTAQASLDQMKVTPENAVQICAKQLKDSLHAEAALRKSGPVAVPALIKALAADETLVRVKAARTLACLGELAVAAVPALTQALGDRDPEIRLAAAKGLWNASKNADSVVPVLVLLLEEKPQQTFPDPDARRQFLQTVMEALWRIGPPAIAARNALVQKTKDKNRMISESALTALKKIAPAMAMK